MGSFNKYVLASWLLGYFSGGASGAKAGRRQGRSRRRTECVSGCENAYPGEGFARSCEVTSGGRESLLLVFSLEVTKRQISALAPNGRFITCRKLTCGGSPRQPGGSPSPACDVYSGSAWWLWWQTEQVGPGLGTSFSHRDMAEK